MNRSRCALVVLAAALAGILVAGCGSSKTKVDVVTVTAPAPTQTESSQPTTASTSTKTTAPPTTTTNATTDTAPPAPSGSGGAGTDTAPASADGSGGVGTGSGAALATVKGKGYTPSVTYSFKPGNTLGVILGTRGAGDQRAFFFVRGHFIGTDTSDPSAGITLVAQDDTSATISYALYKPGDQLCCPSDHKSITYALDNGKLEPQGEIPSSSKSAALSRR